MTTQTDREGCLEHTSGSGAVIIRLNDPIALTGKQAAQLGEAIMYDEDGTLGLTLAQMGCLAILDDVERERVEVPA